MTSWVLLAVGAQFLAALTILIDKRIVARTEHLGRPIVYTFFVMLLSGFVIVLAPLGYVSVPANNVLVLALFNAVTFGAGLFFLYSALRDARTSDVAPVVGAVSAIATVLCASFFLKDDIVLTHIPAILLLAVGTAVISHFHFSRKAIVNTLLAGVFFGATAFSAKLIFLDTSFIDGFFWTRMMNVVVAIGLLLIPALRAGIFHGGKRASSSAKGLLISNKVIGGIAGVLTSLAISLGSVSIVNALAGLQFVFLFIFAFFFARRASFFGDTGHGGWHSAVGVVLIVAGLAGLFLT
ncbi:MAG: hypothetical protein WA021_05595 [Minisyncoccia bacterium]